MLRLIITPVLGLLALIVFVLFFAGLIVITLPFWGFIIGLFSGVFEVLF